MGPDSHGELYIEIVYHPNYIKTLFFRRIPEGLWWVGRLGPIAPTGLSKPESINPLIFANKTSFSQS